MIGATGQHLTQLLPPGREILVLAGIDQIAGCAREEAARQIKGFKTIGCRVLAAKAFQIRIIQGLQPKRHPIDPG